MIVCPLIRSVGLKAATASSRVRDVADVRPRPSVPHPPDDLTQLGTIGRDNKVDRQPSAGRASGGPAMVTSVPPARITPADRFVRDGAPPLQLGAPGARNRQLTATDYGEDQHHSRRREPSAVSWLLRRLRR